MVRVMEMISNGKEYRIFDIHWGNSDSNLETNYKMDQFADFTTTTLGIICGRTFSKTFIVLSKFSKYRTISVGIIALYLFAIANATSQLEHENVPGVVESLKVVTEKNTERLCRFAFDYARENGRKKVTVVHKAVRRYIICLCLILFYNVSRTTTRPILVKLISILEYNETNGWIVLGNR